MSKNKLVNVRKLTIPDDNKCFFHCINQACFNGTATVEQLKQICARTVLADKFYEPFLESTKEEYARDVLHPDFWGGHIEQVVFSRECGVEFVIIFSGGKDIRRISHATTPPKKRVYLEYCGKKDGRYTHYNLFVHGPEKNPCGVFETDDPDNELALVLTVAISEDKNVSVTEKTQNNEKPSSSAPVTQKPKNESSYSVPVIQKPRTEPSSYSIPVIHKTRTEPPTEHSYPIPVIHKTRNEPSYSYPEKDTKIWGNNNYGYDDSADDDEEDSESERRRTRDLEDGLHQSRFRRAMHGMRNISLFDRFFADPFEF